MQFSAPVRTGKFRKRYKRFFADITLDSGEELVAHVPNTGSLKGCLFENAPCVVTESNNPARKLKATLHFLKTPTSWVGVDTGLPNQLAYEAWAAKSISDWVHLEAAQREYKISKETRLDMVLAPSQQDLEAKQNLHFIEIKSVTLAQGDTAYFPDAVTTRGQKHLKELLALKQKGFATEILFVVQRQDCQFFSPADEIDPEYGRLLRQVHDSGVRVRALGCDIDPLKGISLVTAEQLELKF